MELLAISALFVVGLVVLLVLRTPHDQPIAKDVSCKPQRPFNAKAKVSTPTQKTIEGPAYVVDGDTIRIKKTQIRLFGVDAPEMNHPYGKKAKWALLGLCKGNVVKAEITDQDIHGRTVAICRLADGRDLSAEMVKCGLAIDWPKYSGGRYKSLEVSDARKKMWLADARQKGRMHVWETYEGRQTTARA